MRVQLADVNFVRVVIVITSGLGVFTLLLRHFSKAKWLNEDLPNEMTQNLYTNQWLDFAQDFTAGLMFKRRTWFSNRFWIEAICLMICPIPYWDQYFHIEALNITNRSEQLKVYYLVSDLILVFMFVRVFFVVRAVFNYNLFTDLYSKKLCRSYGFTANLRFAYKCLLKSDPGLTVFMTLLSSVFFLAYQLRIFEMPYYLAID
jgi:hypothetical protein